tara:strand:+ start:253 stop:396 length:144 start_codon:yes stop_codon:yes gene_type:complete
MLVELVVETVVDLMVEDLAVEVVVLEMVEVVVDAHLSTEMEPIALAR